MESRPPLPPMVTLSEPGVAERMGVRGKGRPAGVRCVVRIVAWHGGESWFPPLLRLPLNMVITPGAQRHHFLRRSPKTGGATESGGFIAQGAPFSRAFFACSTCPLLMGKWSVLARARLPRIFARVYGGRLAAVNTPPAATTAAHPAGRRAQASGGWPRTRAAGRRRPRSGRQARLSQDAGPRPAASEAQAGV